MKTTAIVLLASVLALGLSSCDRHGNVRGMRGEGGGGGHGLRKACRAELEQYCASDQRGRERRQCLQSHRDKLSEDCKTALDKRGHGGGGGRKRDKDKDNDDND